MPQPGNTTNMSEKLDIDIERLCISEGIHIAKRGERHHREGWVSLECPFCIGDKGHHLGYSKQAKVFTCWRCGKKTVPEVLSVLLNKTKYAACNYAREHYSNDPFSVYHKPQKTDYVTELRIPGTKIPSAIHTEYLTKRNYDVQELIDTWDIQFTTALHKHQYRIIAPVWDSGRYVSYVGRDVTGKQAAKYLACLPGEEVKNIKQCVYGMQRAIRRTVIVVEGVFDAWRIGSGAIAMLGTSWRLEQAEIIARSFAASYILFDNELDAQVRAKQLAETCSGLSKKHISKVVKISNTTANDPSEFSAEEVEKIKGVLK